ncbi:AHH domain-containing protein [Archangium violaceum]|uniref:Uncharacterized protein n=1 Tax=Archangium violaceum Cb vi76 TaxID=1406225 RepID=A0A084SWF1_9BACT|nr:AHH domain-containing protein [Archangium violaceum]KFA92786.1 hypothetical protein Q664_13070 [Archangium violaceum Cb vi76]
MAKKNDKLKDFEDPQKLQDGESEIFNPDLSAKAGNFPELDDANYPQKLIQELKKKKDENDKEADNCPPERPPQTYLRGFHKYRTAAYIHDQKGGHNGDGHFKKWPDYGTQVLEDASYAEIITPEQLALLKEQSAWEEHAAFPMNGLQGKYSRKSERFLITHVRQHKFKSVAVGKNNVRDRIVTGQHKPYRWTAHHLIPHELLQLKAGKKKQGLENDEYDLLIQSGYDINNGHNGIIIPGTDWGVPFHCIIRHCGNHAAYTTYAKELITDVISGLQALADEPPTDHKSALANVLQKLTDAEDELWLHVINLGKQHVPSALKGEKISAPQVTQRKGKKTFSNFAILN